MQLSHSGKYVIFGLIGIAGLSIAGCGNNLERTHRDCLKTSNFYYTSREECEANNGDWGRWGLNPEERCNMRAGDYGVPCDSSCDCEGDCIVNSNLEGSCSEHVTEFGCYSIFDEEGRVYEICTD